ncbi:DUF4389 domain-containing protein [Amycolatopsis pithecellobii]|uniref:DUF4389 domain-containing protein n=1 Tax=Amycolatopsis pithecellobii TaxID=664692 RepID=A0A6N7ZBP3_9PSEU|nr:DUF4389 domain-containing protein [Amycolatopsis pithecellobii]MTD59194.1 DUF4389 domain-containing protein [Amycolatopsis pithecellobii]
MTAHMPYPVRVQARLDPKLSRWLWLVKWLLAIPHYFVLAFLWFAFAVLTVVAFFAILFTGRYPRSVFDFNVGVMRWTWRVQYYAYAALGTDLYPPFTLADVPGYPARLDVAYPQRLSRGLVLVKWWLLAIPQYLIVALFVGGGTWFAWNGRSGNFDWAGGGLVGVLVFVAGVVLLFTGRYPKPIHDFVVGLDRWVVRVGAYAALMTDQYPPFRLDLGGQDPGGPLGEAAAIGDIGTRHRWTAGRVVSVVAGAVLALTAVGLLTGGSALLWADKSGRGADGYLSVSNTFTTSTYALTTEAFDPAPVTSSVGDVRIRVTATDPAQAIFVGIAPVAPVRDYLANVSYVTVRDPSTRDLTVHSGTQAAVLPQDTAIWTARASGTGTQTLSVPAAGNDWALVVMNPNGAPGLDIRAEVGATAPGLGWIATGLIVTGVVLLAGGAVLVAVPIHLASRHMQNQ